MPFFVVFIDFGKAFDTVSRQGLWQVLKKYGHVERMDHQRLLRQLLHSQLCEGKRNQGRPRLRFKDTVKRNLKKLDIDKSSWQRKVKDRAA